MRINKIKLIKICNSFYIIVPSDVDKKFNLHENLYSVDILNNGEKIVYTKAEDD